LSSQKKRARQLARRREQRWHVAQARKGARRRRGWAIAAALTAVVLVAGVIVAVATRPDQPSAATADTPSASPPLPAVAQDRTWTSVVHTSGGDLTMSLDGAAAPQAVASFITLARSGFFDGTSCHRLTTGESFKVLQCGDPTATGSGGPGYSFGPIENAPTDGFYPAGTVAMARRSGDANSMGSQFFLVYGDTTLPDDAAGGYTVFGTITSGLEVLQAVADAGTTNGSSDGAPVTPVTIEGVETQ
jgi:peptidyl-prolyl cis-trans isomerase B (cyclophilin B)